MDDQTTPAKRTRRKRIPVAAEIALFSKSRRRCCICFGLNSDMEPKEGQIAHLDKNPANPVESNLVWLCLQHHNQYDSVTSQSKNLQPHEITMYRAELYEAVEAKRVEAIQAAPRNASPAFSLWDEEKSEIVKEARGNKTADKMIQYRGHGPMIGLCRLRIYNIAGRQIVVIVSQFPDNPGTSITNVAESLATQVYEDELKCPRNGMIWIEHYVTPSYPEVETYNRVTFKDTEEGFADPEWEPMTGDQVEAIVGQVI